MNTKTIQLPDHECTGCGACVQICPKEAITFSLSDDGHYYPHINDDKCIRCAKCMDSCHALASSEKRVPSHCYAAVLKDQNILKKSTSGGLFHAMAQTMISDGGVVYACVYDSRYHAYIERITSVEEFSSVYGSKYVWSSSEKSYPSVRDDLKAGKKVLYTALPCQVSGLLKFLGKEYENLLTVDVLCGGAPSPFAFEKYLQTLTDDKGLSKLNFQFRDKDRFGCGVNCTYTVNGKKHYENYIENSFYFSFCSKSRISWRRSCYQCDYKSIKRVSDMTIGDFWGVENYHPAFDRKKGVSVVMVNTEKGATLFDAIKGMLDYEESQFVNVIPKNSLVSSEEEGHHPIPSDRDAFFKTLREEGWTAADQKYLMTKTRKDLLRNQNSVFRKLKRIFK